jgi:hypothetical protein
MVRGPFFQRASAVVTQPHNYTGFTELHVAQLMVDGRLQRSRTGFATTYGIMPVLRRMRNITMSGGAIPLANTGCRGRCRTTVKV